MTLSFLNARLNVTPKTVATSYQFLLHFVAPKNYVAIEKILTNEKKDIIDGDISSVFYVTRYQINPQTLTVTVEGNLQWWFGLKKMKDQQKTYRLNYAWSNGQLRILSMAEGDTPHPHTTGETNE